MNMYESQTTGRLSAIISNLVNIELEGPARQNEICFIEHEGHRLMAEVIRITGNVAQAQVFDSTRGLKINTPVVFTGHMLEATLGPGLLSKKYDGLQNDLEKLPGLFLERGTHSSPLDEDKEYNFIPLAKEGDVVSAGDWLGEVQEGWIPHKIMVPLTFKGQFRVGFISPSAVLRINDTVAILLDQEGQEHKVTMVQRWPVKKAFLGYREKIRPDTILETGVRAIDTLNPLPEGGTGFIPGPFGCGKTVLQHAISKNANADLIVLVACGERANEVVEIFKTFPELEDTRTGRKLIERTTIVCNTSNMPVAAREASVYTGMTIAEYYRSMGLKVLLLADSTSRWAQALREMSNRLEELPGPDAFPMDLTATITAFYARAGKVILKNGRTGSVTFLGTVSPAGGNLKEPVTESTRKAARCFYALSQKRADSKRYPAIDPLDSYSKYLEYGEFREKLNDIMAPGWAELVEEARDILRQSSEAREQISILGDDSVPVDYHEIFWKGELIDFVILQQDAFDKIDANTPLARQVYMLRLVLEICRQNFPFSHFEDVSSFFKKLIHLLKQMNYSAFASETFQRYEKEVRELIDEATKGRG
ncbi:MAG: V-type ATP synthase subunit A [Leptospiraceae bacterium]|nr:V-type ATP synthase subunit A [Leptospiraceae bacterium]MDW8306945.1 V-type ATP synthase subunit A [Leptospiraceae bacterium]